VKVKKTPLVSKEKVIELYYEQKKSLQDIAKEYGCTKQWVSLLMKKHGLNRRTLSEAQKVAKHGC
jgi:transposase-like protein